jgi:hypothetical protein
MLHIFNTAQHRIPTALSKRLVLPISTDSGCIYHNCFHRSYHRSPSFHNQSLLNLGMLVKIHGDTGITYGLPPRSRLYAASTTVRNKQSNLTTYKSVLT